MPNTMRSMAMARKNPHAHGHADDHHQVVDIGHLFGENLQIGLRNRDKYADDETHERDQPDFFALS